MSEVNFIIAKAVNSSTFVVLGGDFNKYGSGKSVSFRFCLNLGLVNLFAGHCLVNTLIWCNLKSVEKTIDYIFVSNSLSSTVAKHWVGFVSEFFDTDHNTVAVSVGLGGLLDSLLEKALVDSANKIFFKHWFSVFQCSKNMQSSKFLGLELLVVKIVKKLGSADILGFNCLAKKWASLNAVNTLALENIVCNGQKSEDILKYLLLIRKRYRKFKLHKSKLAQEASIKEAVKKYMEKFCLDKESMIKSVLNRPFQKVVLDHLVVNDELILEPDKIRLSVNSIMEGWMRKCVVSSVLSGLWTYQYAPLDYVRDSTFSGVMDVVSIDELLSVIGGLPDGKATGLSGISNEL
ncbi:hypothetical protein G9A89_013244 [Geosiphon pyriformis]|nr:hypothetical protein G9A89_013244 [Geosiphon pyriformis]